MGAVALLAARRSPSTRDADDLRGSSVRLSGDRDACSRVRRRACSRERSIASPIRPGAATRAPSAARSASARRRRGSARAGRRARSWSDRPSPRHATSPRDSLRHDPGTVRRRASPPGDAPRADGTSRRRAPRRAARRPPRGGARRVGAATALVTYSPKVFIPLTTLCRDVCGYCTFARPPRRGERAFMTRGRGARDRARGRRGRLPRGAVHARRQAGAALQGRARRARGARLRDDARVPRARARGACSRRPGCCRTSTRA